MRSRLHARLQKLERRESDLCGLTDEELRERLIDVCLKLIPTELLRIFRPVFRNEDEARRVLEGLAGQQREPVGEMIDDALRRGLLPAMIEAGSARAR